MGVAVIHPFLAARELASGELVMPFNLMVSTGDVGITSVIRNAQADNPVIGMFVDWLKAQAHSTLTSK